jgi:hypothetical protein
MIPLVIECANHKFSPYSFLCKHLIDSPKQKWVGMEVDDGREVEYDWLCEECFANHEQGDQLEDLIVPICIGCVEILKNAEEI